MARLTLDSAAISTPHEHRRHADLRVGTDVEVRRRFDRAWARGFEVHEVTDSGYRLKRCSDGVVLPVAFAEIDVREANGR